MQNTKLMGKSFGVTGDDPDPEAIIKEMINARGGTIMSFGYAQDQQVIVVGRQQFDPVYLTNSINIAVKYKYSIFFLSQEDFIDYLFYDTLVLYQKGDPRITSHPGLSFIASIGFKWPSTIAKPNKSSLGEFDFTLTEHPLSYEYGYNVRQGTTLAARRAALRLALQDQRRLTLQQVVEHLAFVIRINKKRHDERMAEAIKRWEEDLKWLYENYYKNSAYSFKWPKV